MAEVFFFFFWCMKIKSERILTVLDAILYDASMVSCPFNIFRPLTLNLITLKAFSCTVEDKQGSLMNLPANDSELWLQYHG